MWKTPWGNRFPPRGIDKETCSHNFSDWTLRAFIGPGLFLGSTSHVSTFAKTHASSFWQCGSCLARCDPRLGLNRRYLGQWRRPGPALGRG